VRWAPAFAALALAACAAPPPPRLAAEAAAARPSALGAAEPGAVYAREREEQRRGIGVPPALPRPGAVDGLSGTLRASRPVPGTGPAGPPALPVPGNALSRLSALPASPLANPPGFAAGWR
jgi:hypothetical protein